MLESDEAVNMAVPDDLVELGRITTAYGVRGWVKIQPYEVSSETLLKAQAWWLRRPVPPIQAESGKLPPASRIKVLKCRTHSNTIIASLEGITDRTQAEQLRGCTIWVPRSEFPALEDDEYYWVDLIGCSVYGEKNGRSVLLGQVAGVFDNGVHAVLRVTRLTLDEQGVPTPALDAKGRNIETLVPFVSAHVYTVDLDNRRLESNWPADF